MESDGFNGVAVFLVLAVITGIFGYLAVMQSRVKKQIEESRRERESADLTDLGNTLAPTTLITPPDNTPTIEPAASPDTTPSSLPKITTGGTPTIPPPRLLPDPDVNHPSSGPHHPTSPSPDSGGTWSGGSGFDSGSTGSDTSGGHHGGHH